MASAPYGPAYDPVRLVGIQSKIEQGIYLAMLQAAATGQDLMRSNAPWTDRNLPSRNGLNARQSLSGSVEVIGDFKEIAVVLSGDRQSTRAWRGWPGAPVSAFLELKTRRMSRKYEVIRPTQQTVAISILPRNLEGLFNRLTY